MSKSSRTILATAALILTLPALAIDDIKPTIPTMPTVAAAFDAMRMELQAASISSRNERANPLDKLSAFKFSVATNQKLIDAFGTDQLATLTRTPEARGKTTYRFTLQPHTIPETGNRNAVSWSELVADIISDKKRHTMLMTARWPGLSFGDNALQMTLRNMSMTNMTSTQGITSAKLGLSKSELKVGSLSVQATGLTSAIVINDMRVQSDFVPRGKVLDVNYGYQIKNIAAFGDQIDDFQMRLRATNLDLAAIKDFQTQTEVEVKKNKNNDAAQNTAMMTPLFKSVGQALIARGAAFIIDDLSARYHGQSVSLKGRVSIVDAIDSDFDSIASIIKKVVAHFDIRLSLAMVQDIAGTVVRKELAATPGAVVNDEMVAQKVLGLNDWINALVKEGYVRLEHGVLLTAIDVRGGKVTLNGKDLDSPAPSPEPINPIQVVTSQPSSAILQRLNRGK